MNLQELKRNRMSELEKHLAPLLSDIVINDDFAYHNSLIIFSIIRTNTVLFFKEFLPNKITELVEQKLVEQELVTIISDKIKIDIKAVIIM